MMSNLTQRSMATTSGSGTSNSDAFVFEVLFYERKNKVHKSKGVSKRDGTLTIHAVTGKIVLKDTLCFDDDDDDDGEDCGGRVTAKQRANQLKKQRKQPKSIPFSGTNKPLAKRCCHGTDDGPMLQDDDTIVLGGFEVQILSCPSSKKIPTTSSLLASKKPPLLTSSLQQRPKQPANNMNRSTGIVRKVVAKPLVSTRSRLGVAQAGKPASKGGSLGRQIAAPAKKILKRPPAQPSAIATAPPLQTKAILVSQTKKQKLGISRTKTPSTATISNGLHNKENNAAVYPNVPLPASLRTVLRPHQVEGVDFLWKALTKTVTPGRRNGAILADEMGLGKTLMTISVICGMFRATREKHFIVVCPSSLVANWAKEFDKWIGKASSPKRVVIKDGSADSISRLKSVYSSKRIGGQVVVMSYEILRRVVDHFQGHPIGLLVVDEGHRLKNQDSLTLGALESLDTDARLLISATPLQNNIGEFYNLVEFVCPGLLGDLATFRKEFERPIAASTRKNATLSQKAHGQEQSQILDTKIKPFFLRRLQKDVLKAMLPPRKEVLLFCRPSTQQKASYANICRNAQGPGTADALTKLTDLRKLCNHPQLLESSDAATLESYDVADSGKLVALEALVKAIRAEGEKVVIVSNFTTALSLIEATILRKLNLPFCRLDGSTKLVDRQPMVDTFNRASSSVFAFLLSSKAGGCGLTLVGASRLILFDPSFNGCDDAQAAARIYRPGQLKPCMIYRLFTSGAIDEVILQRQLAKDSLAVFDSAKAKEKFTADELAECFELKHCLCDTKLKVGKLWDEYAGPESIDCDDEPLLACVQDEIVTFVHFVSEKETLLAEESITATGTGATSSIGSDYDTDSASSEDEFE